jgi:DNA polymerase III alpha subunit (gram-positive type)
MFCVPSGVTANCATVSKFEESARKSPKGLAKRLLPAHDAGFDIAFLNAELKRAGRAPIATERVIDALMLARRQHAGGPTLDDLCSRYGVDRSHRTQHGALLDAELLRELSGCPSRRALQHWRLGARRLIGRDHFRRIVYKLG